MPDLTNLAIAIGCLGLAWLLTKLPEDPAGGDDA